MLEKKRRPTPRSKMIDNLNEAMGNEYSEEIRPMIQNFLEKYVKNEIKLEGGAREYYVQSITEIIKHTSMNTRKDKMNKEDIKSLEKIFGEIEMLYLEAMKFEQYEYKEDFVNKIKCLDEILYNNMLKIDNQTENYRNGMIFQNYEDLWKILHRINTEWSDLCNRGFSRKVFYDYWGVLKDNKNIGEKERMKYFMDILEGNLKFVPIYKEEFVGFTLVKRECNKQQEIVKTSREYKSYYMQPSGK